MDEVAGKVNLRHEADVLGLAGQEVGADMVGKDGLGSFQVVGRWLGKFGFGESSIFTSFKYSEVIFSFLK